jgi:hypothetical protein
MTRWIRRALRQCGFDLPFRPVVCPEEIKTITIDAQWRAKVTVRRMLVFLDLPEEGDLRDIVPVDPDTDAECSILESPDALDVGRRPAASGTCVYWWPREPLARYALYTHQRSWSSPAWDSKEVFYTELLCHGRTGIMALEIVAPTAFQAAVGFKAPWWTRFASERRLMKHALRQIDTSRVRPIIRDARQRVEWRVVEPRAGARYICIAFSPEGLAEWQQRVAATSVSGRLRRLFRTSRRSQAPDADRMLLPRA